LAGAAKKNPNLPRNKPNRMGCPTKYRPEFVAEVATLAKQGKTITGIAAHFGVVRETIYDWMDKHPDFSDAIKLAKTTQLGVLEDVLLKQAKGVIEGNTAAIIWAMKNQHPEQYQDRRDLNVKVEQVVEINFLGYDGDEPAIDGEFTEVDNFYLETDD
jgi:transposase-like protein